MARKGGYSRFLILINLIGDLAIVNCAFILAYIFVLRFKFFGEVENEYFMLEMLFNLAWLIVISYLRISDINRNTKIEEILWNVFKSIGLHALLILAIIALVKGNIFSRAHLGFTYILMVIGLLVWRLVFYNSLKNYRKKGANFRQVAILGAGRVGHDIYSYLTAYDTHGYKFLGFFDDNPEASIHKDKVLGKISDFKEYHKLKTFDEIFIALPLSSTRIIRDIVAFADNNMIRVKIIPDFRGFLNKRVNIDFYDYSPVLTLRAEPLENLANRFVKRSFDIIFSGLVIVLVFPWLFPIIAILIKLSSNGPILFVQDRSGRNNEVFPCYKFRSMSVNKDADKMQAVASDPRITWVGKMLRKSNLDEVPQFFNVFLGNMSVVGPRPHMLKHTEDYSKLIDKFMVRHLVKPGITGLAQVSGYRGPTEDKRKMYKRVLHDVWYIENWSFLLDVKIIYLTVANMIKGEKNAF